MLFQLLTDQGFLNEGSVVWETLENIEGDGDFVDSDFVPVPPRSVESMMTPADRQAQEDSDYLLALTLQEEDKRNVDKYKEWEQFKVETGMEGLTDEQLAKRLQEEEDGRISAGTEGHPSTSNISGTSSRTRHVSGSGKTALIHPSDPHIEGSHLVESKPSSGSKVSKNLSSHNPSTCRHHHPSRNHPHLLEETHPRLPRDPQPQHPSNASQRPSSSNQRPSSSNQHRSHSPTRTRGPGSPQDGKRGDRSDRHSESTGGGGGAGRDSRSSGKKSCIIQ